VKLPLKRRFVNHSVLIATKKPELIHLTTIRTAGFRPGAAYDGASTPDGKIDITDALLVQRKVNGLNDV
jgi:hypothetical protein